MHSKVSDALYRAETGRIVPNAHAESIDDTVPDAKSGNVPTEEEVSYIAEILTTLPPEADTIAVGRSGVKNIVFVVESTNRVPPLMDIFIESEES